MSNKILKQLLIGNQRYVAGNPHHPNQTPTHRASLTAGQQPFAIVLTCADSRVPPELVFDCGLGELFVIRLAGNILTPAALASIDYAVQNLDTPLIVVLGHTQCGAVGAAIQFFGKMAPGNFGVLTEAIAPAVAAAQQQPGDLAENATRANAQHVAEQLAQASSLAPYLAKGELTIAPAVYDLESGRVTPL